MDSAQNSKEILFRKLSEIELLVRDIYLRFSELFEEDRDFWWRLAIEEGDHSSLILAGMETFEPMHLFPEEVKAFSIDELDESIARKKELLDQVKRPSCSMSREEALRYSAAMEMSDIERCFQLLMEEVDDESRERQLFQRLNRDSAEHGRRIFARIKDLETK